MLESGWLVRGWCMEPALETEHRSLPHRLRRGQDCSADRGLKDAAGRWGRSPRSQARNPLGTLAPS